MIEILVVEDEKAISDLLRINLTQAGYHCTCAEDGMEGADLLEQKNYDLVLLDIMLPKINGYELMEYIRPMGIPVIFLTAKGNLNDRIQGLTSGAEDYIVKPFEVVELLARINIVLRRYHKLEACLSWEDIKINEEQQRVTQAGREIKLTPREFALLEFFVRNQGITLFREKIYEEIWGSECQSESRTLDLHVQRLRRKLDFHGALTTVFKVGYCLKKPGDRYEISV